MKILPNYTVSNSFVNTIADKGKVWWANAEKRVYIIAAVCWMAVALAVFLLHRYLNRVNNHIDKDKNEVQVIPSTGLLPNPEKANIDKIKKAIPNLNLEPSFDNHQIEKEITPDPTQTKQPAINLVDERPVAPELPALSAEEQKIKAQIEAMNTNGNFNTIEIQTFPNALDVEKEMTPDPTQTEEPAINLVDEGCYQITDKGLEAIAEKLQGLTHLYIRGCDKITDKGLKAIAEKLKGLMNLDISGCDKITDKGLEAVAEKLKGLTKLNISYCYRITDKGLEAITEKLEGLTHLDISSCDQITDKGLEAIAKKLQSLTYLDISGCDKITDKGLKAIADKLQGLAINK